MIKISVVIPTYNGANKILNVLSSLEKQTFREFEVIVVIDGSTDKTQEILAESQFNFPLKVVYQANKGRAGARNTGANKASAEWLIFVDDDMRLEPDALQKHWEFHQKTSSAILVGNQIEDWEVLKSDLQKYKAFLSRKWGNSVVHHQPMPAEKFFLTSSNCSMSKTLFQ
ncbi:MAG: glycosyltransferase family 2 protein, partial [Raineya sp.]|nr:glycosyltransferase family 2 protein [Raineya sp.]